jgi:site-specific recombinase XerD
VQAALWAYVLERGGRRGPLFRTSHHRRPLSSREICRIVREAARRAEIPRAVTPKVLRHTYATHLMDSGVDLAVIARLMGHRSPRETGVYLHALKDRPRQAVDQLKNLSKTKPPAAGEEL